MAALEKWCTEVETMEQIFSLIFLGSETIAICVNSLFSNFSVMIIIFIYNGILKSLTRVNQDPSELFCKGEGVQW